MSMNERFEVVEDLSDNIAPKRVYFCVTKGVEPPVQFVGIRVGLNNGDDGRWEAARVLMDLSDQPPHANKNWIAGRVGPAVTRTMVELTVKAVAGKGAGEWEVVSEGEGPIPMPAKRALGYLGVAAEAIYGPEALEGLVLASDIAPETPGSS